MEKIKPTKKQAEYLAYIRRRKTPVDTKELSVAKYVSASAVRENLEKLVRYGYLEKFNHEGLNGVVRPHYRALPVTKSKPTPKPKPELKPKKEVKPKKESEVKKEPPPEEPTAVVKRPVVRRNKEFKYPIHDAENFSHNMEVAKHAWVEYLEDTKKVRVVNPSAQNFKSKRLGELRRSHMLSMNQWFVPWYFIQTIPFTNPTGRMRTQAEINDVVKTGTL